MNFGFRTESHKQPIEPKQDVGAEINRCEQSHETAWYFQGYLSAASKAQEIASDPWPLKQLLEETTPASQAFFESPTTDLAKTLLGSVLLHDGVAGMIVETEAYLGVNDLAAHSSRGETPRTKVIFGPPGHAYVYFIYGMHECLNIVAEPEGVPGCVLIRALEPLTGLNQMSRRRHWNGPVKGLANGPGKLTEALAITREQYGAPLTKGELTIRQWKHPRQFTIAATPRIGIKHCIDWPLRFVWSGHPCLSKPA